MAGKEAPKPPEVENPDNNDDSTTDKGGTTEMVASNVGDELNPDAPQPVTPAEAQDREQEPTNVFMGVKPVNLDPFKEDVDNPFDQQGYRGVDLNRQFARPSETEQPFNEGENQHDSSVFDK